jgi:hypothetical protein
MMPEQLLHSSRSYPLCDVINRLLNYLRLLKLLAGLFNAHCGKPETLLLMLITIYIVISTRRIL